MHSITKVEQNAYLVDGLMIFPQQLVFGKQNIQTD